MAAIRIITIITCICLSIHVDAQERGKNQTSSRQDSIPEWAKKRNAEDPTWDAHVLFLKDGKIMKKKVCLIDGSGYIFRAFYALPMLTSPQGVPVNAVLGFMNMFMRMN